MNEARKDYLFTPPSPEFKKSHTFTMTMHTPVDLYHSIPRGPDGRGKSLMGKANPGLEVEIEGTSWQQFCKERDPKRNPAAVWVLVTVVSPGSNYRGIQAFVTMGDITRLPEGMRQENQEKQQPLTRRMRPRREKQPTVSQPETISQTNKPPRVETKTGTEETFELRLPVGTRLFIEHPRPRLEEEAKDQRNKYLDETADWVTKGRTIITISGNRKETWANENHWMGGKVVVATREDLYPRDEDVKPLNLGQEAFVSKGEASPKRPKKKE